MNKKIFGNELFQEKEAQKKFVINKPPVYTLKECLENSNEDNFILFSMTCQDEFSKLKTKTEKIDFLVKHIQKLYRESLVRLTTSEEMEKCLTTGISDTFHLVFHISGFMYTFKDKNKYYYIIPKEITEIYQESTKLNSEIALKKAENILTSYIAINGLLPKDVIKEIIRRYKINIDEKALADIMKKKEIIIVNDQYYVMPFKGPSDSYSEIIEAKEKTSYKYLSDLELETYNMMRSEFISDIMESLGISQSSAADILIRYYTIEYYSPDEVIDELLKEKKLKKKDIEALKDILITYEGHHRYWLYNGKTSGEYEYDCIVDKHTLVKKPKTKALKDCLENLSEEALEETKFYYAGQDNLDLLSEAIIADFKENIDTVEYVTKLQELDNKEFLYDINPENIEFGYVFLYQDKDTLKWLVPKEIKEVLNNVNLDELESEDDGYFDLSELYTPDIGEIVFCYINMNGIIKKEILLDMLKEYHDYDGKISDLDKLVKAQKLTILDKDYYCINDGFSKKEAEELKKLKDIFGEYKIFTSDILDEEERILEETDEYLQNETTLSQDKIEDFVGGIYMILKHAIFNKEIINELISMTKVELSENQKRKVMEIIKSGKNDVSTWVFNGFSINEMQKKNANRNKKVGRNEPCPCESGKKYKQCCGR